MLKKILVSVVAVVMAGAGLTWYIANHQARRIVDERITALVDSGRYDKLSYDSLNVDPDGSIDMSGLLIEQDGVSVIIDSIEITDFDYAHEVPWTMNMAMSGFRFPEGLGKLMEEENPVAAAYLSQMLTNESLPLQMRYQYAYNPENDHQIDAKMHMGLADSFDFTLQSVTRKIALEALTNPELNNPDPAVAMSQITALLTAGELPSTTVTLQDHGILNTLLESAAQTSNATPEDVRNLLSSQAKNFYLFAPQNVQGVAMQAGIQLAEFLQGGKTLAISINPEFGGNFQQLQPQIMGAVFSGDFNAVVELLHLEIETR